MDNYILTPEAEDDLEKIWRYTFRKWGDKQADIYLDKINAGIKTIGAGEARAKTHHAIDADLESYHCEHHYIFYLALDEPIIMAVLHEKMDLINRIKERLNAN